jgi:hypothetical protein
MVGFLLGDVLASPRVGNAAAIKDGFLAGLFGSPILGALIASAIASRQPQLLTTQNTGSVATSRSERVAVLSPGIGAARLRNLGTMPSFHGMQIEQAEEFATLLGLQVEIEGTGVVVWQEPGIGKRPNPNNILRLKTDD